DEPPAPGHLTLHSRIQRQRFLLLSSESPAAARAGPGYRDRGRPPGGLLSGRGLPLRRGFRLGGRAQAGGGPGQLTRELALLGDQPVEEVEGGGHDLLWRRQGARPRERGWRRQLGQLADERHGGQLRGGGVHRLDGPLDGVEGDLLALADGGEHLLLHVLAGGGGHGYLLGKG